MLISIIDIAATMSTFSVVDKDLASLKNLRTIGIETPRSQLIGTMAGCTSADSFRVLMGKAKKQGRPLPRQECILENVPTTNEQLQSRIKELFKLSGVPGKIFDHLAAEGGTSRSKAEIAMHLGNDIKNDSFRVMLGKLTSKKVAAKNGDSSFELTAMFFSRRQE